MGWKKELVTAQTICGRSRAVLSLLLGHLCCFPSNTVFNLERSASDQRDSPCDGTIWGESRAAASLCTVKMFSHVSHSNPNKSLNTASDIIEARLSNRFVSILY